MSDASDNRFYREKGPIDYSFRPLHDIACRLYAEAKELNRRADELNIKAAQVRVEADQIVGAYERLKHRDKLGNAVAPEETEPENTCDIEGHEWACDHENDPPVCIHCGATQ